MPIERFSEQFALSIGGLLVSYRHYEFNAGRANVTEIIAELDSLNRQFRREEKWFSVLSNRVHYWQLIIGTVITCMGGGIGVPQALFALYSGKLYYDHIFPVDTSEVSTAFFVIWAFQSFTVCSCATCSSLQECSLTDCFIQLTLNFHVLNEKARQLRRRRDFDQGIDEEAEYAKLIEIIRLSQQLKR